MRPTPPPSCLNVTRHKTLILLVSIAMASARAEASAPSGTGDLLPLTPTGADAFRHAHPTWDGRGVVVAILDEGVDMTAQGLTKTSTGAPKVIEARDFSGEGDVRLEKAVREDSADGVRWRTGAGVVRGLEGLPRQPSDGTWWVGFLDERRLAEAAGGDANGNGRRDDRFAIAVARIGAGPDDVLAYLDAGADGSLEGDKAVRPFHVAQELLRPLVADPKKAVAHLALAFEPALDERKAVLHFTDGSHGTHVAAIATGHAIFDRAGFDGVAPGAQVLSLKIGDSTIAGGSTTTGSMRRALEFAARWADEHKVPVVCNMSYGFRSAREGGSEIDRLLDEIARKNPRLTIAVSAGNEGPGYSSVGTPAGASLVFSAGAALSPAEAGALYGVAIPAVRIFPFSSRGGELLKPDGLAPGAASASVPIWDKGDHKHGTSMASPQVAGAMALLWSAAVAEGISKNIHAGLVRRALTYTAAPLPGYTALEQGGGLIRIPDAWQALVALARSPLDRAVLGFAIESDAPTDHGHKGTAAFWRTGQWHPTDPRGASFRIRPVFADGVPKAERERFEAIYDLTGDAGFAEPGNRVVHLRGEREAVVRFRYQAASLREPGLHVARLVAKPRGASVREGAFALVNAVVVPLRFGGEDDYRRIWKEIKLAPSDVRRFFVLVPPGARRMEIEARASQGAAATVRMGLYDPGGNGVHLDASDVLGDQGRKALASREGEELTQGVWEITFAGSVRNHMTSKVDLEIRFASARVTTLRAIGMSAGETPSGTVQITNTWDRPFHGTGSGEVWGWARTSTHEVRSDVFTLPVGLDATVSEATLQVRVDAESYARLTDCALEVRSASGEVLVRGALEHPYARLTVKRPGAEAAQLSLHVRAAFARETPSKWELTVTEEHRLVRPVAVQAASGGGDSPFDLWPGIPAEVRLSLPARPPMPPDGFDLQGEVRLLNASDGRRFVTIPIRLER